MTTSKFCTYSAKCYLRKHFWFSNLNSKNFLMCSTSSAAKRSTCHSFSTKSSLSSKSQSAKIALDPVEVSRYMTFSNDKAREDLVGNMLVCEDFITEEEEESFMKEIDPYMRRLRYEYDHWDDAIHGYRETERRNWNEENKKVLQRVQDLAFPPEIAKLAYIHILDLEKSGYIKPHIDAVRFCGSTIAGLSLLSSSVMRLVHETHKDRYADVLLMQRSLYIMKNTARYSYTHEILPEDASKFQGQTVPRDRRISVIMRNEPDPGFYLHTDCIDTRYTYEVAMCANRDACNGSRDVNANSRARAILHKTDSIIDHDNSISNSHDDERDFLSEIKPVQSK